MHMARLGRRDDTYPWIAFTDFLVTLALLFYVGYAEARDRTGVIRSATVIGVAVSAHTDKGVADCDVFVDGAAVKRTDAAGRFTLQIDSLGKASRVTISARCDRLESFQSVGIKPGETTTVSLRIAAEHRMVERIIPGDALFQTASSTLTAEGVDSILAVGRALRASHQPEYIIVVQGHTDDQRFRAGSQRNNLMLSGLRAAAAAAVLTDGAYHLSIPECWVRIQGFGSSQPIEAIIASDGPAEIDRKRALNRRIEFREVRADVSLRSQKSECPES